MQTAAATATISPVNAPSVSPGPLIATPTDGDPCQFSIKSDYYRLDGEFDDIYVNFGGFFGSYGAQLFAAAPDTTAALKLLVERIEANGEWDDGCFYYNGRSASELQGPLDRAHTAIAKAEAIR